MQNFDYFADLMYNGRQFHLYKSVGNTSNTKLVKIMLTLKL